ncbi:signal transduction histidine kinase [Nocardioides marinisabuli]|uniref:histidine kinase n=1 Tax=Nocardioides marinisabuli TaxID=419476 RepID=A0A7Y9JNU0_9ACTN|nr:GAF domain-containing sensor histidine kinase [Nocardioides marinisabuli]NYD56227.1 signal transduction histidine kinase [Nocardioides marinisabuli]
MLVVGRRPARTPVGRFVSGPGVPALCALALVASVAVDARGEAGSLGDRLTQGPGWPWTLNGLVIASLAAVVTARDPRSRFGWALAGFGLFWAVDGLAQSWLYAGVTDTSAWPGSTLALWFWGRVGSLLPVVAAVLLLLFPTGRFLPGRWGRASGAVLVVMGGAVLVFLLTPAPVPAALPAALDPDPFSLGWLGEPAPSIARTVTVLGFAVPIATVVVRYRGSEGVERDRMRWLLWSVLVMALTVVAGAFYDGPGDDLLTSFVVMVLPAAAMVVAVVEPGLVPVRDLLTRTLAWAGLGLLVLAVDLAAVGLLDTLLTGWGGEGLSQREVVALVLLVSALVHVPLRARVWTWARRLVFGERAAPYDVVARLAARLEHTDDAAAQLREVAVAVAAAFGVGFVRVEVERGGEVLSASHGTEPTQVRVLPITDRGREVGRLMLPARGMRSRLSSRDERLLGDLVRQAALAVRTARLAEELQESRERLVVAREEERRRIRRDLHDGLGPALGGVVFRLETARLTVGSDPAAAGASLQETAVMVQDVVADVRRLVHELRPPALDDRGLVGALRQLAEQAGPEVSVGAADLPELPAAVEVAAYRIAAEALTNVARHARAGRAEVRLAHEAGGLLVEVADDGVGVSPGAQAGVGMLSLRERADELGGRAEVVCPGLDGAGTLVRAWLPLGVAR